MIRKLGSAALSVRRLYAPAGGAATTSGYTAFMWLAGANGSLSRPRAELALLVLASSLAVLALGIAVTYGPALAPAEWRATLILVLSAASGGTLLAAAMGVMAALRRDGWARR